MKAVQNALEEAENASALADIASKQADKQLDYARSTINEVSALFYQQQLVLAKKLKTVKLEVSEN